MRVTYNERVNSFDELTLFLCSALPITESTNHFVLNALSFKHQSNISITAYSPMLKLLQRLVLRVTP